MSGRRRSHWGWGWEDRFPDRAAREGIATAATALLGFPPGSVQDPIPIDAVTVPEPRLDIPASLSGHVSRDADSRIRHTYGRNYRDILRGFQGRFEHPPDAVATPADEEEVTAVLDWAEQARAAVIPFGGGTGVVSGVEADVGDTYRGAVSLDLRSMGGVREVDPVSKAARIGGGARGPEIEGSLAGHGLTLRHFPQSFEFSTLGGWIATRAGGHFATGPTHIEDLVESVRMITPRGVMESRRLPGSGAGPSPDRLVAGSEGILGVIISAWMRLRDRPVHRSSATVRFASWDQGVAAVRHIAQSGLQPANCRLLDAAEAALNQVVQDGSHVLVLGFESAHHPQHDLMEQALEIAAGNGGTCPDGPRHRSSPDEKVGDGAGRWRTAFLDAPYLLNTLISAGLVVDTFETAVTWDRFGDLHATVLSEVRRAMDDACGAGFVSCRFTHVYSDGPAPYFTFIAPGRSGAEERQWREIRQAGAEAVLATGGTITHHHAVGRLHRPWYDRQRPEPFAAALRAAKSALDPAGIMNPGVLVDRVS